VKEGVVGDDRAGVGIRLLGPLALSVDGKEVSLGGPRQRAVLALLALAPNRTVPVERIIVDLWGDGPLKQPRNNVQVYVSNLRRLLRGHEDQVAIAGDGLGYRLQVASGVVDHMRFTELVAEGRRQADRGLALAAARSTRAALELWRGDFLDDLATQFDVFSDAAMRAHEERLHASAQWVAAELDCGEPAELVPPLERLVAAHPLHERFWEQLMTALSLAGRQRDALHAFQRARQVLAEEAGLSPGHGLRALEGELLSGRAPARPRAAEGTVLVHADASGAVRRVPLRPGTSYLIGRHPGADVPIEWDARASRRHAVLEHAAFVDHRPGRSGDVAHEREWTLSDCGSTNGTFLHGRRLPAGEPVRVSVGDVFVAGATAFVLRDLGDAGGVVRSPSEVTVMAPGTPTGSEPQQAGGAS
jgi:DNA-binding SARP family transcriptional activator